MRHHHPARFSSPLATAVAIALTPSIMIAQAAFDPAPPEHAENTDPILASFAEKTGASEALDTTSTTGRMGRV